MAETTTPSPDTTTHKPAPPHELTCMVDLLQTSRTFKTADRARQHLKDSLLKAGPWAVEANVRYRRRTRGIR
jgi:hypothetical protein